MAGRDPESTEQLAERRRAFVFRRFQVTVTLGPDAGKSRRADRPELAAGRRSRQLRGLQPAATPGRSASSAAPISA